MGFPKIPYDITNKISFSGEVFADLIFFICTFIVAIFSLIMFFHWRKYSVEGGKVLAVTEIVYVTVSVVLLSFAFFSLN